MSLFKIWQKLLDMGLNTGQADEVIDMVREFGLDALRAVGVSYVPPS